MEYKKHFRNFFVTEISALFQRYYCAQGFRTGAAYDDMRITAIVYMDESGNAVSIQDTQQCGVDSRLLPIIYEHDSALDGMALLVDCQFAEAAALFSAHKETYSSMALGHCLTVVLRAITSFEEDHKNEAMEALKVVQHDCHSDHGRFRAVLSDCQDSTQYVDENRKQNSFVSIARYQIDLVLADCYLCSAMITMMNMDWSSYARGGWIVRKSWKLYEKLYRETRKLNDTVAVELRKSSHASSQINGSIQESANAKAVARLYADVCFGYGLFNLLLSILSPQVLKVISFLGFSSSRRVGLECLAYASRGDGMRSALATLSLLWFHTVARPFFALDADAIDAGVEEAERLLSSHYSWRLRNTMLFIFFQGRMQRLRSDIFGAIDHYFKALSSAGAQKELRQMCQYELGWSYLHLKDWRLALPYFNELRETSKWAPSYYAYMVSLCSGSCGDMDAAFFHFTDTTKAVKNKKNPLEAFALRRAKKILKIRSSITQNQCVLMLLEVMYIWRALLNVPLDIGEMMLSECCNIYDSGWLLPLKCLLEAILLERLNQPQEDIEQRLRECIARCDNREHKDEKHWLAFATYELGYLLMKKEESRAEAKVLLVQAKDKFHGCDFDNRLSMRVFAALKWIEKTEARQDEISRTLS